MKHHLPHSVGETTDFQNRCFTAVLALQLRPEFVLGQMGEAEGRRLHCIPSLYNDA